MSLLCLFIGVQRGPYTDKVSVPANAVSVGKKGGFGFCWPDFMSMELASTSMSASCMHNVHFKLTLLVIVPVYGSNHMSSGSVQWQCAVGIN